MIWCLSTPGRRKRGYAHEDGSRRGEGARGNGGGIGNGAGGNGNGSAGERGTGSAGTRGNGSSGGSACGNGQWRHRRKWRRRQTQPSPVEKTAAASVKTEVAAPVDEADKPGAQIKNGYELF